jgi:hypothetical protein
MNQLIAVCILLFMTSEGFASKSAEKISEKVLARVLSQVVASKPFEDYKAAREPSYKTSFDFARSREDFGSQS